jgi:2-polyprenyl-3-methyl-5-hydroxy-6-metoxy-1,4-benzoquinol methylase
MNKMELYEVWWNEQTVGEQRMENEHLSHWQKVLGFVEEQDLHASEVLDFGCNQGGFLRYLYAQRPFRAGVGIDLARRSIEIANQRKGSLPIQYEATSTPEQFNHQFNLAISISVIYLIADLKEHAWKIKQALKPGGVYYATYSDYENNPSLPSMQEKINLHGSVPMNLHTLDDIAEAFLDEGFQVGIRRMTPSGYTELSSKERWFNRVSDRLMFEYEQAYIFRFTAPL